MSAENIEANQEKFVGEHAQKYDNESSFQLGREISRKVLEYPNPSAPAAGSPEALEVAKAQSGSGAFDDTVSAFWDPRTTRVLDFACGTGIISAYLAAYSKQVVGVDIAKDMLDIFNAKVHNQGIPSDEVQGYLLNIFDDEDVAKGNKIVPGGLDNFDAAVTSLAYHHIDDIDQASRALFARLRSGGWVYVVDLSMGPGFKPSAEKDAVVPHHGGFAPETIGNSLRDAGFVDVKEKNIFAASLWATEEYISRFQKHHTTSLTGNDDETKDYKELHGMRIYDEKVEKGVTKYLVKKPMLLVVGKRP
ncbi:uncharacterized protein SAPINGB_P003385 [Magnusiomyces paraingens]|uniref:Methyltransferase type 11 domain-containing protein n=1 Tax=Magnusiomyces paraingens TaxID=2606893 RepID=A0A5E8BP34_9ASCO|nr:uncharacterized protein SAPINGB_P003385 [Saprochaete ingens]VVT53063.1 unnamed protein product [Saprochaete ingens]